MINLPIFSTNYSLGKSILTLKKATDEIDQSATISLFSIAKVHKLNKIFLAEDNLCGFFEAFSNCKKNDIQLCFGLNIKVVNSVKEEDNSESVVTVWIKNSDGYDDILKINDFANNEGYLDEVPRIDWITLNKLITKNLMVTIPFYSGFLAQNSMNYGRNCLPDLSNINPIFIVNNQGLPFDKDLEIITNNYAEKNNYNIINGHNIYYYDDSHADALQVFRCITIKTSNNKRRNLEKPEFPDFCSNQFSFTSYVRSFGNNFSGDKFGELFEPYKIDKLTNGVRLPEIKITEEEKLKFGLDKDASNYDYLSSLVAYGLKTKILSDENKKDKYEQYVLRCKEELDVFKRLHLVDYILLVADVVNFAKNSGIPTGFARGSSSGSLVCYLTGITAIDSLEYDLYFTRFLSEGRIQTHEIDGDVYLRGSIADIDSDVSKFRRHEVIEYIQKRFFGKTSKIGTVSTLSGKALIKDATKIMLNYNETDAQFLSNMVERVFGKVTKLKEVRSETQQFDAWVNESPDHEKCFTVARQLEDLITHRGQHASGVLISHEDISTIVPMVRGINTEGEEYFASAYDMDSVSNILCKLDVLGLKTLDTIYDTLAQINKKLSDINFKDQTIYDYLQYSDNLHGLFQIEKGLGKSVVLKIRPKGPDQVAVCISINRPGALKSIDKLVEFYKNGTMDSICPEMDKILIDTGGIIIYQEQINRICQEVYRMSPQDADNVRASICKKKREEMEKWEPVLYKQGEKYGISEEATKHFWTVCDSSADYLFSKNHAVPYSQLTIIDAYLKANYPLEFFNALLRTAAKETNPSEEISAIHKEIQRFGIKLLPLSLQKSSRDFEIEGKDIRFGYSGVKGIGPAAQEKLLTFNGISNNKLELFDNCINAKLGLGVVVALIQAGTFPDYNQSRARTILEYQTYNILSEREQRLARDICNADGEQNVFKIIKYLHTNKDSKGKQYIKDSRLETIKKKYQGYKDIYEYNKQHDKVLNYLMEKQVLSYSYNSNLCELYAEEYPEITKIEEALTDLPDSSHTIIGTVSSINERKSRKGNPYIEIHLEDDNSSAKLMAFNDRMNYFKDEKDKLIKEDTIVVVRGKTKDEMTMFVDWAKPLFDIKLAKRASDIK